MTLTVTVHLTLELEEKIREEIAAPRSDLPGWTLALEWVLNEAHVRYDDESEDDYNDRHGEEHQF